MSVDIRMPESHFSLDGKDYILRCNFNVLADVQEMNGGFLPDTLDGKGSLNTFLMFMSAMLNDYADEQGWEERFTPKSLGRKISFGTDGTLLNEVMTLVIKSIYKKADETEPKDSKN